MTTAEMVGTLFGFLAPFVAGLLTGRKIQSAVWGCAFGFVAYAAHIGIDATGLHVAVGWAAQVVIPMVAVVLLVRHPAVRR